MDEDVTSRVIMTGDVTPDYFGGDVTPGVIMTGNATSGYILYWGSIIWGPIILGTYRAGDVPSGASHLGTY